MCVIIVCPKGVKRPSRTILDKAKMVNPHGFGFVSDTESFKTMDYNKFIKRLNKVGENENVIIHFRYATHGSKNERNCHPFDCNGLYFAHNGILPVDVRNDMTDSETAFINELYPAYEKYGYESKEFDSVCREVAGCSKFAFLSNGSLKMVGTYYEMDGVFYSNLRFSFCNNNVNVLNM